MRRREVRDQPSHRDADRFPWARPLGEYLSIPFLLAAAPIVGFLFGWFLDRTFNTSPWITIGLLVLGFIAGAREVWMHVKRFVSSKQDTKK